MDIKEGIYQIKKRHGTCNPFEIADDLNIKVIYEELGNINGYYNSQFRMKQIHINHNISEQLQQFTCAHELGHAILHPNANTPFLRKSTFLSINKLEIEANKFASELLIPDEVILENWQLTTEQFSRLTGYSEDLIKLRLQ